VAREAPLEQGRSVSLSTQHAELRALMPLYVVVFIGFVGYSLMITVFTPMLLRADSTMLVPASTMAHRTISLGVLLCLYPLGQFVGSPILGSLSDRFGRGRVLLNSLSVTTLCYAAISFSIAAHNLPALGLATLVAGLAEANIVTAQGAIADIVPAEQRNSYFGYIHMAASLAYIVGPLGGGKLADPKLVSWFSDASPFWASFILLMLTALAVLVLFRETKAPDAAQHFGLAEMFASLAHVFTDSRLRRFYAVNFLLYLVIFGFFRSYPMYLVDEFHLNVSRISEFVAWAGFPIVLANIWLTGFLSARLPTKVMTIGSALLTGAFMALVVVPGTQLGLWPVLFLTGAGLAVCLPSCATSLSNAADAADQGLVMGNNQAVQVAAEAVSGLAAGLLAAIVVKLPLLVLGGVAIGAAILVAVLV
jgi:MFS family permease